MKIVDFFRGKVLAWCAFALVIVMVVCTFMLHQPWYAFIAVFFAFMAAFVNLVSVTLRKINPYVSAKLDTCTFIFLILFVLSFIAEWIAFNVDF